MGNKVKCALIVVVVVIVLITGYIYLYHKMPAKVNKIDDLADLSASVTSPAGCMTDTDTDNAIKGYHIIRDMFDDYNNDVVVFGRADPMQPLPALFPVELPAPAPDPDPKPEKNPQKNTDNIDDDDPIKDKDNDGDSKTVPANNDPVLVPVPYDRKIAELFYNAGVLPVGIEYFGVSSGFGVRQDPFNGDIGPHMGIDISAGLDDDGESIIDGKPVYAVADGVIYCIQLDDKSGQNYGNLVVISHGAFVTYYAHLKNIETGITSGKQIQSGQVIGYVGSTGYSTGPHLHFELRIDGMPTDPFPYLFEILRRELSDVTK